MQIETKEKMMNKEFHLKNLDRVYNSWVRYSSFTFIPKVMEIEDFMYEYDDLLRPDQKKFLRSLLDVIVSIQNFENIEV